MLTMACSEVTLGTPVAFPEGGEACGDKDNGPQLVRVRNAGLPRLCIS